LARCAQKDINYERFVVSLNCAQKNLRSLANNQRCLLIVDEDIRSLIGGYRIQVAFSATDLVPYMVSCTALGFVVVVMPPPVAQPVGSAVANGSEDGF
jgi:hypothetical protein